ncbi:hypothetical protein [Parabacteroides pacaensis]|uniref:hypothetical protein n=1 Tax=Parabacteroides pacaensis TaxID=2086575 RepID=UPI000D0F1C90|nr:hypothetical protein [Parabacteroides pacaensis]
MKKNKISRYLTLLFTICLFMACHEDNDNNIYSIDLQGTPDTYETLNASDKLEIPIKITCEAGLKKAFYKIATQKPEEDIKIGSAVDIPVSGYVLDTTITIPVTTDLHSIVFAVYDNNDQINTRTVRIESVKEIPVISFKDDIREKKTVCIGIPFTLSGKVESEYELKNISVVPIVNDQESNSIPVELTDKLSANYSVSVPVVKGLQHVLVKAENIYGGIAMATFHILNVVNTDFIEVSLEGNVTELKRIIKGETNLVSGTVSSGSDITSFKYAIKKKGALGSFAEATLTENMGNEAKFSFPVEGDEGVEAVEVEITNQGGKTITVDYKIPALRTRVAFLENVEMSTDPADNKCFLALYEKTPVFGVSTALEKQNRIDFYLANKGSGVQPLSPHAYGAGTAYYNASLPYIKGFTELTYAYLSSRRGKLIKEEFDNIVTENELDELLEYRIIGPKPDGEGYGIKTASRRVGDTFNTSSKKDGGFIIGWGSHTHPTVSPVVVRNNSFAIVWVKSVTQKANGHYVMVFDVKYPVADQRAANNTASIQPYEPYPL